MGIVAQGGRKINVLDMRNRLRALLGQGPVVEKLNLRQQVGQMVEAGLLDKEVLTRLESSGSLSNSERLQLQRETRVVYKQAKLLAKINGQIDDLRERVDSLVSEEFVSLEESHYLLVNLMQVSQTLEYEPRRALLVEVKRKIREAEKLRYIIRAQNRRNRKNDLTRRRWAFWFAEGKVSPYAALVNNPQSYVTYAQFEEALISYYQCHPNRWFYSMQNVDVVTSDRYGVSLFESVEHFFNVVKQMSVKDLQRIRAISLYLADEAEKIIDEDSFEFLWQKRHVVEEVLLDHEILSGAKFGTNERLLVKMFILGSVSGNPFYIGL